MSKSKTSTNGEHSIKPQEFHGIKHFYGIPHSHTSYSTGKSSPIEAMEYAKNKSIDFLMITDHNDYLQDNVYYKSKVITKWRALEKFIHNFNKKNKNLLIIRGFEAQSNYSCDINIINGNTFFKGTVKNKDSLTFWLLFSEKAIAGINHPGKGLLSLEYSPELNNYLRYIEVGNGIYPNKYKRYDAIYFAMLDKGWKLGAVNSQDNHKLNYGDSSNLTVVMCSELDKRSVIGAFSDFRTYSTESRSFTLLYTINDKLMGSTLPYSEDLLLNFSIIAQDKINKIYKIEIITSGSKVVKTIKDLNQERIRYIFSIPAKRDEHYYVVRIFFDPKEEMEAISSPIFIE